MQYLQIPTREDGPETAVGILLRRLNRIMARLISTPAISFGGLERQPLAGRIIPIPLLEESRMWTSRVSVALMIVQNISDSGPEERISEFVAGIQVLVMLYKQSETPSSGNSTSTEYLMKINAIQNTLLIILLLGGRYPVYSQGSFVNLGFESPVLPLVPNIFGGVPITNALPGWTGYIGANETSGVFYNNVSIGAPAISFHGPGSLLPILQGNYSVLMQPFSGTTAITQMGVVPSTAKSLRFYTTGFFLVSFAGQQIPLSNLGSTSTYTIYGGDISGFADQSGLLQFQGGGTLDNIFFSPLAVPEPGVIGLSAFGALFFCWRLRQKIL